MLQVAIYCRLSDEDKNKQSITDDSESIQNQKSMLSSYAKEKGWCTYKTYCDEDYSGADRNRPEFNQLLEDAKSRKFNIVLCKTQSRFSRDMEIVEKYIHNLFLEWNIRFISLVDNADTEVKGNKKARQINGLINEWFLEDLSDNIRATLRHKKEKGEYTGAFAPYGYKKAEDNKNQLIVDNSSAEVVREVYERFLNGESYNKIANELNSRGVPNPIKYKRENGEKLYSPHSGDLSLLWTRETIRTMLKREIYTGTLVQGKVQNISYKNSKKRAVKSDNWIRVENTHEPIISLDTWNRVQQKLQSRSRCQKYDGMVHIFSQKVFCATCGSLFHKCITHNYHYLRCKSIIVDKNHCTNHKRIRLDELESLVLNEINSLIERYKDDEYLKENINLKNNKKALSSLFDEKRELIAQIEKKENYFKLLYEDKINEVITADEFTALNKNFKKDIEALNKRLGFLKSKIEAYEQKANNDDIVVNMLKKYDKIEALNKSIVDEFIEKIKIGEFDRQTKTRVIDIIWLI